MEIVRTITDVREYVKKARTRDKKIGFVPTMGYLHKGHSSLVRESRRMSDCQVMSIFVNKIQFNDISDFTSYPRDLQRDCAYAEEAGVDLVFVPDDTEMYRSQLAYIDIDLLTGHLCGAHRPGHFRGVYTVVAKLFNIVMPDVAVFGQKDIQQAVTIEKMAHDLNFPVRIIIAPTVREDDGLAMSSRNKHLSGEQRFNALSIIRSLKKAEEMILAGERSAARIIEAMRSVILDGSPQKIDYVEIVSYADLQPVDELAGKSVIAVAAFFGTTRLIDNMIVESGDGDFRCII